MTLEEEMLLQEEREIRRRMQEWERQRRAQLTERFVTTCWALLAYAVLIGLAWWWGLLRPLCAEAATLTVDQQGRGDCTTIAACASRLQPGDTLLIHGGSYQESLSKYDFTGGTSWDAPVTITGAPGETVLWSAPPGCVFPDYCRMPLMIRGGGQQYIIVQNITFHGNGKAQGGVKFGDTGVEGSAHYIVRNVEVKEVEGNYLNFSYLTDALIEDVVLHDNCCEFIGAGGAQLANVGTYLNHIDNVRWNRLWMYNTRGHGMQAYDGTDSITTTNLSVTNSRFEANGLSYNMCAMTLGNVAEVFIANNLFLRNGTPGGGGCAIAVGHAGAAQHVQVLHNTIALNQPCDGCGAVYLQAGDDHVVRDNLFWLNGGSDIALIGGTGTLDHNLTERDPLFVSVANGQVGLLPGSPAAGQGLYLAAVPMDIAGVTRPDPPAIGACEPGSPCTLGGTSPGGASRGAAAAAPFHFRLVHRP